MSKIYSLEFGYANFLKENYGDFIFTDGSSIGDGALQITPNSGNPTYQSGRVLYKETFKLRRSNRSTLTSIDTTFVFNIRPLTRPGGEGLAFILTNNPALPSNSGGQWLGIVNDQTNNKLANHIIAVEFDTRKSYPQDLDDNHIGLDVNGIISKAQLSFGSTNINISSGSDIVVNLQFDAISNLVKVKASTFNETVRGTYIFYFLSYVDLSNYLSEDVWVGFSASTGNLTQLNQIKSWYFRTIDILYCSSLSILFITIIQLIMVSKHYCLKSRFILPSSLIVAPSSNDFNRSCCHYNPPSGSGIVPPTTSLLSRSSNGEAIRQPPKFRLKELKDATANFDPNRELGKGGFGTVYRGCLKWQGFNKDVAVKRILSNSHGGEREFIAEVNAISQLRHRNLVELMGWCHENDELLLVYEFLNRGSLDNLPIWSGKSDSGVLNWERRYNILCGVASALDYLHHGSRNRVLRRDIKASNVMLDDQYTPRLGDFGLARVIERDGKSHHSTVALAGTRGYMAPECYFTGRASVETDVYAFGVFAMEVSCGRMPGNPVPYCYRDEDDESDGSRYIVDWLWDIYGSGDILHAADPRLCGDYDKVQMACVLRLALVCCHPNPPTRPSMRMALQVLTGGALPPNPAPEKPAFMWPVTRSPREVDQLLPSHLMSAGGQMSQSSYGGR
ncbi:unnamed protein product [Musa acuminata var. zebrina]